MDLAQALGTIRQEEERNKIDRYEPYPWQIDFHAAGRTHRERMIRAANRVGKTYSAACEVSYHVTGAYPEWWPGRRFTKETTGWAASVTNEASRDIQQRELLGKQGNRGTGAIPMKNLGRRTKRQAGIGDVVDTQEVKHTTGGKSLITFKSYDQGWRKFQGTAMDWIWLDEEPEDYRIYTECVTRVLDSGGIVLVTFTPLLGVSELVSHFDDDLSGVHMVTATWDQAPHLDEKAKSEILQAYPIHERDARTKGLPMMGTGRVFPMDDKLYTTDPVPLAAHWFRIAGIDFGVDHPFGTAWIAHDKDTDIIYIYDCYKVEGQTPPVHAAAIKKRGKWIPVAWPHDGLQRGKADGIQLKKHYAAEGVGLLSKSAHYAPPSGQKAVLGGQPVEPIVMEITDRINTGRLKIFSTCLPLIEEMRNLHRDKDGKIVAKKDDVFKAMTYAMMMLRYGRQLVSLNQGLPSMRHSILR